MQQVDTMARRGSNVALWCSSGRAAPVPRQELELVTEQSSFKRSPPQGSAGPRSLEETLKQASQCVFGEGFERHDIPAEAWHARLALELAAELIGAHTEGFQPSITSNCRLVLREILQRAFQAPSTAL